MNKKEYNQYLVTGVEDGWIEVGRDIWDKYLKAKKELEMTVTIPFELGEPVYVLERREVVDERKWIKPDCSLGGDVDGPFDRGHYEYTYKTITEIRKVKFHFGLLDKYKITEIYRTRERAEEARDGYCFDEEI